MVFEWLVPKDKEFYGFFEEQSKIIVIASEKLSEILENYSKEKTEIYAGEMKDIEHRADEIAAKIYIKTATSFMTPIDTERIIGLNKELDNIVDMIEKFISMCNVYELICIDRYTLELGNLLKDTSIIIQKNVSYLRDAEKNKENIKKLNGEIRKKEREGDEIYKAAMKELFKSNDAIHIIKTRDVYNTLEDAMDACREVADEISDIITKLA
ncbi:MAG: DUF47 family protein [Candidatus Altarchaeum sp.]|nr:DUF47 family protein [Candidatus Altarchaeum sp.]